MNRTLREGCVQHTPTLVTITDPSYYNDNWRAEFYPNVPQPAIIITGDDLSRLEVIWRSLLRWLRL